MSSTAGNMAREFSGFDVEEALVPAPRGPTASFTGGQHDASDDLVSRALASAGIAALVTLPFLLLTSLLINAPLAVPAAISLGYIAVSRSLASHQHRRAAIFNTAVLIGLVSWLMVFLIGGGPPSGNSLTAALLAPLFAAAPALARALLQKRDSQKGLTLSARDLAVKKVSSLDELAPSESTLLLDNDGRILAATAASRRLLGLLPDAFEHSLAGLVTADDLPKLLDGIGRCRLGGPALELSLEAIEEGSVLEATLSACGGQMVAMKLRGPRKPEPCGKGAGFAPVSSVDIKRDTASAVGSDLGEAVAFAVSHMAAKARSRGIKLMSRVDPGLAASCDRRAARRMAHLLIEAGMNASVSGCEVGIVARRLRGVVLLRITTLPQRAARSGGAFTPIGQCVAELQGLAEGMGGTVMLEEQDGKVILSLRLPQARSESGR